MKNFKLLSVDVFDTTLIRLLPNEEFQFLRVAKKWSKLLSTHGLDVSGLALFRARNDARRVFQLAHKASGSLLDSEISIDDWVGSILDRVIDRATKIGSLDDLKNSMVAIELNEEKRYTMPNRRLIRQINSAKLAGHDVIFLSDMYLSGANILSLLEGSGLNFSDYRVISSSEGAGGKHSGKLFEAVVNKYQLSANQVMHIGDNFQSDFLVPSRLGISARHKVPALARLIRLLKPALALVLKLELTLLNALEDRKLSKHLRYEPFSKHLAVGLSGLFGDQMQLLSKLKEASPAAEFFAVSSEAHLLSQLAERIGVKVTPLPKVNRAATAEHLVDLLSSTGVAERDQIMLEYSGNLEFQGFGEIIKARFGGLFPEPLAAKYVSHAKLNLTEKSAEAGLEIDAIIHGSNSQLVIVDVGWGGTVEYLLSGIVATCRLNCALEHPQIISGVYVGLDREQTAIKRLDRSFGATFQSYRELRKKHLWYPTMLEALLSKKQNTPKIAVEVQNQLLDIASNVADGVYVDGATRRDYLSKLLRKPTRGQAAALGGLMWDFGVTRNEQYSVVAHYGLSSIQMLFAILSSRKLRDSMTLSERVWLEGTLAVHRLLWIKPVVVGLSRFDIASKRIRKRLAKLTS